MSISYSSATFIGVPVTLETFVTHHDAGEPHCEKHGPIESAFCPKCGREPFVKVRRVATKTLWNLSGRVDQSLDSFTCETRLIDVPDAFMIHCVDRVWGEVATEFILGRPVTEVESESPGDYSESPGDYPEFVSIPDFLGVYEEVRDLVTSVELDTSELRLYHRMIRC